MKKILCFGEALIDFLNTGNRRDGLLQVNHFTQFPGGAPANAAVAVARLGGDSAFVGQVGDDPFGHFLVDALKAHGVDTSNTWIHPTAKTALAFVFLDAHGERSFAFHRDNTADLLFGCEQLSEGWFSDQPILHFCSNTLTDAAIAEVTEQLVMVAEKSGSIISFDVNLRHNLWPDNRADADLVNQLVHQAHLIKFASEELDFLSQGDRDAYVQNCFAAGVKAVIVTDGGHTLCFFNAEGGHFEIEPPATDVVDTTGGGDAFIGAVLFGLSQQADPIGYLSDLNRTKSLISFASHCGAWAVSRPGAFPAFPVFDDVQQYWT